MAKATKVRLRALVGLNYGPQNVRVEADETHEFPADVAKVYLEQGLVVPVEDKE